MVEVRDIDGLVGLLTAMDPGQPLSVWGMEMYRCLCYQQIGVCFSHAEA